MSDVGRPEYWQGRWDRDETGWHEECGNALLRRHWAGLKLKPGARVLVPLAGASPDIGWLAEQGYRVCAIEASAVAADRFFREMGVSPERSDTPIGERWHHGPIEFLVGDFFRLGSEAGAFDAAYDRAALVALSESSRSRYADQVMRLLSARARQLLITFEYPRNAIVGPPFSVTAEEIRALYGSRFHVAHLEARSREDSALVEHVYRLCSSSPHFSRGFEIQGKSG